LPVLLNEWCTFLRILHQHFITNTAANTVAGSCLQLHGNLIVTCTKCAQYEKAGMYSSHITWLQQGAHARND